MKKNKKDFNLVNIETFDFDAKLKEYEAQGITAEMLHERVRLKREKLLKLMQKLPIDTGENDHESNNDSE